MQLIECELKLVSKDVLRVIKGVGNDSGLDVILPKNFIKKKEAEEGGDTELTRFEDNIAIVQLIPKLSLRPIHLELYPFPLLVLDVIEIVHSP